MSEKKNDKKKSILSFILNSISLEEYRDLNRNLKYASQTFGTPYFSKQLRRNKLLVIISKVPLILGLGLLFKTITHSYFNESIIFKITSIRNFSSLNDLTRSLTEKDELFLQYSIEFTLLSILLTIVMTKIIKSKNKLLIENNRFVKKYSKGKDDEGGEDAQFYLVCPAGVIFTLGSETAKEIKNDKKFWERLDITPSDYKEDPSNRKIVYFEKGFSLGNSYIY